MLLALAVFGFVAFYASNLRYTPLSVGFLGLPAGVLLSGLADLVPAGGSCRSRVALRLAGAALITVGLLSWVPTIALPGG